MLVMVLDAVPVGVRGELSRWLTPISATVFVGRVSAEIRESLWTLANTHAETGNIIQVWARKGEPGYDIRLRNANAAHRIDLDGIPMIAIQDAAWREAVARFRIVAPAESEADLPPNT